MPLFSIIIPTHNRADLLRAALESVFAQTMSDYEIIVVDDGSTDGTADLASSLAGRVRFLTQSNRGPGPARNLGAQHAIGEYLAFLDSDDLLFPWTLEIYQQVIEQARQPAFVAGKPARFRQPDELKSMTKEQLETAEFSDYLVSGDAWRWWGASSFVIRRDAFQAANGFADEWINGEDADLALRLGCASGFVQITSPTTFGYRDHAVSAMKNLDRTIAGARHQVSSEKKALYPGGNPRAPQRRRILTRHLRPVSLACQAHGMRREAWELYWATFPWHVTLGNWKYLAGFPAKALFNRT